jgi:C4-dicarboxylate-specific signal transduction histidine kinase
MKIRLGFIFLWACVAIALIGVSQEIYTIKKILQLSPDLNDSVRAIAQVAYVMTILGILASFFIAMTLLWVVGRPIAELTKICRRVMAGDESVRIQIHSKTELGIMSKSFNHMLDNLESRKKELLGYQNHLEEKLKESQDNLVQAAKLTLVGEMASTVAHDLRNPLSVISGYSDFLKELAQEKNPDLIKIADCAQKIEIATQRVDWMIDRMNQFNHNKGTQKKQFAVLGVIESSLLFVDGKFKKNGVQIDFPIIDGLKDIQIFGEMGKLEQVFANLFSNAADAMKNSKNRVLKIDVKFTKSTFICLIQDSGTGISNENLENIFKPYFTTKNVGEGTGLGLSICKTILEELEGEITVDSKIGVGTKFTLTLPIFA